MALPMSYVLRDAASANVTCSFDRNGCVSVLNVKSEESVELRRDTYSELECFESLPAAQILSLFSGSQNSGLKYIVQR